MPKYFNMKKSLLIILLIISSLICSAQLQVKEGSFKKVDGFVNINTEKMFDDNDKPYAVLKIKTENINDQQRRELSFGGDAQTFFETEYKDGEVWLYISYYATFLKISHPDLSSTEFWFPFDMEPKCGYELTLVNKQLDNENLMKKIEELEKTVASYNNNKNNDSIESIQNNTPKLHIHIIKSGETLNAISKKYNITVQQLKEWNDMKSNRISVGQKLKVYINE